MKGKAIWNCRVCVIVTVMLVSGCIGLGEEKGEVAPPESLHISEPGQEPQRA